MNILEEANKITSGERQRSYDIPERNMPYIASIASAILRKNITAKDICVIMLAVKFSREMHAHKRDNFVDLAGYIWCWSKVENEK